MSVLNPSWRVLALALLAGSAVLAADTAPLIGHPAPDFALRAFTGENVRLSEHRGEVVVLAFWSSACGTCAAELAALDRSYATYHSAGLTVFGISVEPTERRAVVYARHHRVSFEMLDDPQEVVSRLYEVGTLPTIVLIDRYGMVRALQHDLGPRAGARYLAEIKGLLDE